MKRFFALFGFLVVLSTPSFAIVEFSKEWKSEYADKDADPDFYKTVKKANCYVCHVKGHPDKKKARNEYGNAVHEYLHKEDFSKEYVKANPEEAKAKILEGLKKANEMKSSDGRTFGEKIESKELPATDAGL